MARRAAQCLGASPLQTQRPLTNRTSSGIVCLPARQTYGQRRLMLLDACREVGENRSAMAEPKRLLLLRHAKSSWDDPALADYDRPLAARGRKAAKLIGAYLRREQIRISLVLRSSARRARETLDLVAASGDIQIEPELYGASADQLLERLRRVPDEVDAVMLIGHNPAIQDLAVNPRRRRQRARRAKVPHGRARHTDVHGTLARAGAGARRACRVRHAKRARLTRAGRPL